MALSVIDQGKRFFNKRKYNEVISVLEPHVIDYKDSFSFHFYLGLAFLYRGEMDTARDYFFRARQLKPTDPDLLAVYAVMALRHSDTTNAVEYYLQALEHAPNYKLASKGLEIIRKHNTPEKINALIQSGKIKRLYPRSGKEERLARTVAVSLIILISTVSAAVIVPYILKTREFADTGRADLSDLKLNSNEKKFAVDMEGSYLYVLTQNEILDSYENAQKYFNKRRDNAAQVEINKILSSNAAFSIKQKAQLLTEYFEEPGFDTIKDVYNFSQVKDEPLLYLDCWVVWKGVPANIETGEFSTAFNLLVGYDTKRHLEGVVPVLCDFVAKIDTDRPISVLGQVQLKDGVVFLQGKGIHQSQKPAYNE